MKKAAAIFLSFALLISFEFVSVSEVNASISFPEITSEKYNTPSVYPETGKHPRVLFTYEDISEIKANFSADENEYAYHNFNALKADSSIEELKGTLPKTDFEMTLAKIEAKAFDYIIYGNTDSGSSAISDLITYYSSFNSENSLYTDRNIGYIIFVSAEVYDWCYELLDDAQRETVISYCTTIAQSLSCGFPPKTSKQGALAGNGCEAMVLRDLYAFSIAVYDEYPDAFEYIGSYIEKEYVPIRNEWYKSGSSSQGTSYGPHRFEFDMWSAWLYRSMSGGKELYSADMKNALYMYLYTVTADGWHFTDGDDTVFSVSGKPGRYGNSNAYWLASGYFGDSYLKSEQIRTDDTVSAEFIYTYNSKTPVQFLIINNPGLESGDFNGLPKTEYFGYPNGVMIARTGWDGRLKPDVTSDDAAVYMKIGQEYLSNHQHLDFGSFQIYYKGLLAGNLGMYRSYGSDHDFNYNKETISHNGLLIYNPDEPDNIVPYSDFVWTNSGGQRRTFYHAADYDALKLENSRYGTVTAWGYDEAGDIPKYSYISGDITNAYSDTKVTDVRRSMLFMPNDENIPAVFFVMDKVVSTDASYNKAFLLQCMEEPDVSENKAIIKRQYEGTGYNGKLTVQPLFPKNAVIEKQGGAGYQWYAGGRNILPLDNNLENLLADDNLTYGWGKLLISPPTQQKEDFFLNAMYISDADTESDATAEPIETDDFLGAVIENKAALFAKSSAPLSGEYEFSLETAGEANDVIITGLADGNWQIYEDGIESGIYHTEGEGQLISFTSSANNIKIKYVSLMKPEISLAFGVNSDNSRQIGWGEVSGAKGYALKITDGNSEAVYEASLVEAASVSVPADVFGSGYDYTVSVTALNENPEFNSGTATAALNTRYNGGSGTEEYPYIISDAGSFGLMNGNCGRDIHFRLVNDIELSAEAYQPFEFSGVLTGWDTEGNRKKHRIITADLSSGLFSSLDSGAELRYLTLNGEIYDETDTFTSKLGGFADSVSENAKMIIIDNCINNAVVKGRATYIGGIVGYAFLSDGIKISDSINTGEISNINGGTSYIGGIIGITSSATVIERCANYGNLGEGGNSVGSIIGCEEGSVISESFNAGVLSGKYTGGIIGRISTKTTVTDCYDAGASTSSYMSSVAGFIQKREAVYESKITNFYSTNGYSLSYAASEIKSGTGEGTTISYNNCYYIGSTDELDGTTALTEAQIKAESELNGFDFEKIWCIRKSSYYSYPMLINNLQDGVPYIDSISYMTGEDIYKTELIASFDFESYNLLKDLPVAFVGVKIDKGNAKIIECGVELNEVRYPADLTRITAGGNFGMLLYSNSPDEREYTLRSYVIYNDGISDKYIYLENNDKLKLSAAK